MRPEERDELLIQLRTAILGIDGSDDRGMVGDVKGIEKHLVKLNENVGKNTNFRKNASKIGLGIGIPLLVALILGLLGTFGVI